MSTFIVEFPLKTEPFQEDILDTRFDIARRIYNSMLTVTQKRYKEMVKTKLYRSLMEERRSKEITDERRTEIGTQLAAMRKQYGIDKAAFDRDAVKIRRIYKKNMDADTAQKLATRLWKSFQKFMYGNGKHLWYKRYGTLDSVEGKKNTSGIKYRDRQIEWLGLKIPIVVGKNNDYEEYALKQKIKYNRITRKWMKGKYHYYVQIVFEGHPYIKVNKETGELLHPIGDGDVGLDIGTQTLAVSSNSDVKIHVLADRVQNIDREIRLLNRKMDRSRRVTNPDNYNEDGTIKKQGSKKVIWNKSKHYLKFEGIRRELYRKQSAVRRYQHECLANQIMALGNNFYVEKMNFKALQKRAKETTKTKSGKNHSKKRFGKSIANRAPAMFSSILERKLLNFNVLLNRIDTAKAKASQFNHTDQTYKKKKLSQRWTEVDGQKVQRDMYSAFLIMNVNPDLKSFNIEKCNNRFPHFLELYKKEVARLTGHKNLSSIAI